MATTLAQIAAAVGVQKSTVSRVLNNSPDGARISDRTRQRVMAVAREMGYQPNSAARALSTRRTGNLGLILSDQITDGWRNPYYNRYLAGVEQGCRAAGYNLLLSIYNLSNIDDFIFPPAVGQQAIDGVILAGYVPARVLDRFARLALPCICLGDNLEQPADVVSLACDIPASYVRAMEHLIGLGHRRVMVWDETSRRGLAQRQTTIARLEPIARAAGATIDFAKRPEDHSDRHGGPELFQRWRSRPADRRPTAVVASDQVAAAFLQSLAAAGLRCPDDVSVLSSTDSIIARSTVPPLTALDFDMERVGQTAAELLVGHLDHGVALSTTEPRPGTPIQLIERQSCAAPPHPV